MDKAELRRQIGLVLEDFDNNREADMKGFIDEIEAKVDLYCNQKTKEALDPLIESIRSELNKHHL